MQYTIEYDNEKIILDNDTLIFFISKLTNDSFSTKHIENNIIKVGKETFEHIQQYFNIKKSQYYNYGEIKNVCDYLGENMKLLITEYIVNMNNNINNIMKQILSFFDDVNSFNNFMIKCRKYDQDPLNDFSFYELVTYFSGNDVNYFIDRILNINDYEDAKIIFQWIYYYNKNAIFNINRNKKLNKIRKSILFLRRSGHVIIFENIRYQYYNVSHIDVAVYKSSDDNIKQYIKIDYTGSETVRECRIYVSKSKGNTDQEIINNTAQEIINGIDDRYYVKNKLNKNTLYTFENVFLEFGIANVLKDSNDDVFDFNLIE